MHRVSCMSALALLSFSFLLASAARANFQYSNFNSTAGLVLNGAVAQSEAGIALTPASQWTVGAMWYGTRQTVASGFETTFQFRLTGMGSNPGTISGGDGIAFVIQNVGTSAMGGMGGYIGYDGITNSLAVELDTFLNPNEFGDPNNNHISIHSRGTLANNAYESYSLGRTTAIPTMADTTVHSVRIDYLPGTLRVFLDDDATARLSVPVELSTLLNLTSGTAYVGLTAGTANAWEKHDVLNWSFVPEPGGMMASAFLTLALLCRDRRRR